MRKVFFILVLFFSVVSYAGTDNVGNKRKMTFENDDEFLTYVQKQYFDYIWSGALPNSGLSRVRMLESDPDRDPHTITTGSSGFGIAGIIVGIERGFITKDQGIGRLEKIADFLEKTDRYHGCGRTG